MGFDIGGSNTKVAFINVENGCIKNLITRTVYLPMWKNSEKLSATLRKLAEEVGKSKHIELITITMTAELSDAYGTKSEGVQDILRQTESAFPNVSILVVDVNGELKTLAEARAQSLSVAAANWVATGWLISQLYKNCVVIDVGSTTTSIIPIANGIVTAKGKTDLEKLILGELVYTGSLRTNVAAITNVIPVKNCFARVSSEFFAQSADVHLILGNITEEQYTVESSDGRERTRKESLARLARVVCADTDMLTEQEIFQIAQYVCTQQINQIAAALIQIRDCLKKIGAHNDFAIITGLGKNFLAGKAASQAGFSKIIDFGELVNNDVARVSTAFAVALMGASYLQGSLVNWMQ
ncbi:MAG TPA: hydantoinase/oxoprolinase family protein [Candidatus Sulfotelmatobacter sp.]|nr:hydantoinase/oxoprolinase family protein [Candidatus Sulfotelmatobacter sp.]